MRGLADSDQEPCSYDVSVCVVAKQGLARFWISGEGRTAVAESMELCYIRASLVERIRCTVSRILNLRKSLKL